MRVEVPELGIVPVLKATVRPAEGVAVIETVPANPFNAVIVIVVVPEMPVLRASVDGLAETMKSTTVKVAVVLWIMPPLVPVMVRVYVEAVEELHDTVAVLELVRLLGVIALQLMPAGTVSVRATVPANPLIGVSVIDEVEAEPAFTGAGEVADTVKLGGAPKANIAVAEWLREPLVPLMVTVYTFWLAELQDRVAVPEPDRLLGEIALQFRPVGTVSDNAIVPVKPFTDVSVIVEVVVCPALTDVGVLAAMMKSGCIGWLKLNVAVAECTSEPLLPVIVRL